MIIPVWQPRGSSSHQIASKYSKVFGEKVTHTGTLDPMAEGVLVLLTGEDRFLKGKLEWQKTYDFSILWGVQTDSFDMLGLIQKIGPILVSLDKLQKVIDAFPLEYEQTVPLFSALRWQGLSGFELAKTKSYVPEKKRSVSLSGLVLKNSEYISSQEVLAQQQQAVQKVHGDFRQSEVLKSWKKSFEQISESFLVTHHQVTTSPGTYIRQLVQDMARQLDLPATTWSITRTANGPYTKEDCLLVPISHQTEASI